MCYYLNLLTSIKLYQLFQKVLVIKKNLGGPAFYPGTHTIIDRFSCHVFLVFSPACLFCSLAGSSQFFGGLSLSLGGVSLF